MLNFENIDDRAATIAESENEWTRYAGGCDPSVAWLLSDRDVWYANPFYTGAPVPHPEADYDYDYDNDDVC